ncbi:FAD binding domain-containing protein [Sedimentitalea sp. HM32M-2]|uniref:FAD binding domain-containing protein n=1 Tax=Sedimentitalea sp. HM32M-2 TaxID=3351566 RepID=UPI00362F5B11
MSAYHRPETLKDALAILARSPAVVAAGCTDLFPATERQTLAGPVLDITAIAGLRGMRETTQGWRIGATTTWRDVLDAPLPPGFDMLKQAARQIGSPQIQNAGTVAGNLCNASPAADGVPPLLALQAQVELTGPQGPRRLNLADFLCGVRQTRRRDDELLTAIHIPCAAGAGRSVFLKLGARKHLVISIAMVAVRLVAAQGRVVDLALAVGACSPVAVRLHAQEQVLVGQPLPDLAARLDPAAVAADLAPISDFRADAAYRTEAAVALLRRALAGLQPGAPDMVS